MEFLNPLPYHIRYSGKPVIFFFLSTDTHIVSTYSVFNNKGVFHGVVNTARASILETVSKKMINVSKVVKILLYSFMYRVVARKERKPTRSRFYSESLSSLPDI